MMGSDFNVDDALYDRQNRLNQPEYSPAQGDDGLFSSDFEQSVGQDNTMGDIFSQGQGTNPIGGFDSSQFGVGQQPQMQTTNAEDKFFDAMSKGVKGVGKFLKEVIGSVHGLTPKFASVYGKNVTYTGGVVSAVGCICCLFRIGCGLDLLLGGIISTAIGVMTLMFTIEKASTYSSQYTDDNKRQQPIQQEPIAQEIAFDNSFESAEDFNSFAFDNEDSEGGFEDEDEDYFDEDDFDFSTEDLEDLSAEVETAEPESSDDVLNSLQDVKNGMYTRQFIYDAFVRVLSNIKVDFAKVKEYEEDDGVFLSWDKIVQKAAEVTGLKDDEVPYLIKLEENLFTIKATISRTSKMKPEIIADEIAKAYAYNTYNRAEDRAKVTAQAETVLDTCIITVFTGASHIISLKDMYGKCKDFVLDSSNKIPVVLGINELGEVITADFRKLESMIIAGMPRSGKSWFVQTVLVQMCMFLPPDELNIYFLDPKAGTSDFRNFIVPHVKKFASRYTDANGNIVNKEYDSILDVLRWIVNVEAPRRKKLIGGHGKVNINDFKDAYPDIKLPIIYVVVDEMVTLSDMVKEDEKEYQSYIKMIVTQFPNLGIKGMFIPHEVKNQVIDKTAYDSIKARISVKGSPSHIESSTGTKPRDFKYSLCNRGDMAVKIDEVSAKTVFVHAVALSDSNDANLQIFTFIRRFWLKYAPDEFADSVASNLEEDASMKELLDKANDDSEDFDLFADDTDTDSEPDLGVSNILNKPITQEDALNSNMSSLIDDAEDDFLSSFR